MSNEQNHSASWYFYHKKSKKRLGPFSVHALCQLMIQNKINLDHILICRPDWDQWKNPMDVMEFLHPFQEIIQNQEGLLPNIEEEITVPTPKNHSAESSENTKTHITLVKEPIPSNPSPVSQPPVSSSTVQEQKVEKIKPIARPDFGLELELKVILISKKKSYRTKTIHLSLDGMHLNESLPEHYHEHPVEVFLTSPDFKTTVKFKAQLVSNHESMASLKFTDPHPEGINHLETWIEILKEKKSKKTIKKSA